MPWAAGTFSRLYGPAGWVADRQNGTKILATRHDDHDEDLATGINNALAKDGTNAATADISMGGFDLTNLPNPPGGATHAASKAYVDSLSTLPFTSGDQIIFRNAGGTAPTGWAIVSAQNNVALRIIGSGVPSSFAGTGFTTVFSATRATTSESSHTHTGTTNNGSASEQLAVGGAGILTVAQHTHTFATGAGSAHSHTSNLAVSYYDMNLIQKT
jgi:hypothetical protein